MTAEWRGERRACDICGAEFIPRTRDQKRCSFGCRKEANRRNMRELMRAKRKAERAERERLLAEHMDPAYYGKPGR